MSHNYVGLSVCMWVQDRKALEGKQREVEKVEAELAKIKEKAEQDQERYTAAQKHFHAVSAGLSSSDDGGRDATLNEQLMG